MLYEVITYETELGGVEDLPLIVVHLNQIFSGTETNAVFIEGVFQISEDYVELSQGDSFGKMEVSTISSSRNNFV